MREHESEQGQAVAILAVVMALVMLGFIGFALDVGYFFHEKRMIQGAADAAALAAAEEYGYGNTSSQAQTAANAAAKVNGFNTALSTNPATVVLSTSSTGSYASGGSAPSSWVQATVSQPISGLFMQAFNSGLSTMTISATAYAGEGSVATPCVCLEGTSGETLNMSNNAKLTASSCGITVDSTSNSAVGVVGSANITAPTLNIASTGWTSSANVNNGGSISSSTKITTGASSCAPAMPTAPVDTTCSANPMSSISGGGVAYTVGPGSSYGTTVGGNMVCYNALTVGGNGDTATLNAGIYVINGGSLHFLSGNINGGGSGVMFYLENGASLTVDNGANMSLSAPTSGTYSGILFYQQATDTTTLSFQGGSSTVVSGAVYAPGAAITLGNGSGSAMTSAIVAQSLTMNGGGTLTTASVGGSGGSGGSAKLTQ